MTNTFPYYLSLIDVSKSFSDNLNHLFFDRTAVFADDSSKVITADVATSGLYASIIKAIAEGNTTVVELCKRLNEDSSKISKYIKRLVADNVLIRRTAFHSKRDIHYEIVDPMMAFFYRFIREDVEWIKFGEGKAFRARKEAAIKEFIEHGFEKVCLTYLEYLNKNSKLLTFYRHFENLTIDNSSLGRSIEIDVVATDDDNLLIAESKLSSQQRTYRDYHDMLEDTSIPPLSNYQNKELYLFGANGFTDELKKS